MRRQLFRVIPWFVLAIVITAPVFASEHTDVEGTYVVGGAHAEGENAGVLVRIAAYGDCFLVVTMTGDPSQKWPPAIVSIGIGILHGGVLAVSDYGEDLARVVAYRVEDRGRRLVGRWTFVDGDGTVQEQTLTKVPGRFELPKEVSRGIAR